MVVLFVLFVFVITCGFGEEVLPIIGTFWVYVEGIVCVESKYRLKVVADVETGEVGEVGKVGETGKVGEVDRSCRFLYLFVF